jgi:metal-responsive CopG/Arc/MetJ family transcriptional regulator
MKTIAITVDEETLALIDELYDASTTFRSRSALVRAAIREYAILARKRADEERERAIIHANKDRLNKELAALISEQATQ